MGLTPTRKIAIGATLAATAVALTGIGIAVAPSSSAAAACGVLFDDFNYSSRTDAALGQRGWSVRSTSGGPGVAGARWLADNVSFPTVDGQKVACCRGVDGADAEERGRRQRHRRRPILRQVAKRRRAALQG